MTAPLMITGSSGFIGSALVRRCEKLGIEYVPFDLEHGDDILSEGLSETMPEGCVVVHLAALSDNTQCNLRPALAYRVNVEGTRNVVNAAHARKAKQLILASSEWVYEGLDGPCPEDRRLDPHSMGIYARTKWRAEQECVHLQPYRSTILRFGMAYGPRQHASDCALHRAPAYEPGPCDCGAGGSAVEGIFREVRDGGALSPDGNIRMVGVGSVDTARRFIHVEDIVSGVLASVGRDGYEVYNLTGDDLVRLGDLVTIAERVTGERAIIYSELAEPSVRDAPNTLARKALNWKPEYDLERGLRTLLESVPA